MTIKIIILKIISLLEMMVPIIIGLAVLYFLWGLYGYISNINDEKKRSESLKFILHGLIGIFVMIAMWGFVYLILDTFDLPGNNSVIPLINFNNFN